MGLNKILNQSLSHWMRADGPHNTVAISSRIRLARNLTEFPFPGQANSDQLEEIEAKVRRWWNKGGLESLDKTNYMSVKELSNTQRQSLVANHMVSPNFVQQNHGAVLTNEDESISVMINEEDHLRIQSLYPGLQLEHTWQLASQVDDIFDKGFNYAWSQEIGYLTCCPTNVGTGLRASVMLHLPGLAISGQLPVVLGTISKLGVAVRGLYGEGSEAHGNLYQVSNQITLGQTEEEIIEGLNRVALQVIRQELDIRQKLLEQDHFLLEDKAWRANGILANARILTSTEALEYASDLRLGIDLDMLPGIDPGILQKILVFTRPGYLQKIFGQELTARERDIKRAQLIREIVNKK